MFGNFQKILYYILLFLPFVTAVLCLTMSLGAIWILLITAVVVVFDVIGLRLWLSLCIKQIPANPFETEEISPADDQFFYAFLSYVVPVIASQLDLTNSGTVIVAIICVIMMILSGVVHLNPLFLLLGYHVYSIGSKDGVSGYLMITKRDIRKLKDIGKVRHVFQFFLLDAEK